MHKRMSKRSRVPVEDRCQVAYCQNEFGLVYLKRRICNFCWDELAAEDQPREALYEALKVPKSLRWLRKRAKK